MKIAFPKVSFRLPAFLKNSSPFKFTSKIRVEEWIGLSVGEQEIKLAVVTSSIPGRKEVAYLRSLSIREVPEEEIPKRLQALLDEMKIKNPRFVGVVPSQWAITRNIEIPSCDPNEIREIVNLQASRNTPYSRSEIVVDYLNLGVFKSVYTKILLVIAPRVAVNRCYGVLEKLNLKLGRMIFAPEAMVRSAEKRFHLESEKSPACLIRVDTNTSDFAVVFHGLLLYVRNIPTGALLLAVEKEAQLIHFVEEVRKSLEAYQSENIGPPPSAIFLTGAVSEEQGLHSMIMDVLKLEVKRVEELEGMTVHPDAKSGPSSATISFLDVAAPLLCLEELTVDLSPEENKLRRSVEARSKEIVRTGILSMILLGLTGFTFLSHLFFRKAQIVELEHRFAPLKKEAKELEQAYTQIQAVRNYLAERGKSIETLAELYDLLPIDIFLADIKFDENSKLSMKGSALSRSSIFGFVGALEGSALFRNVQTKYVTERKEEDKVLSDFEIITSFES